MKKLIIAAVAVAIATCVQAASFSWATSMTGKVYEPGTETLLASATAYLFDTTAVTQSSLATAFGKGTLNLANETSLSNKAIANGAIANTTFTDGTAVGDSLSAYFAAIVSIDSKDYLFISDVASGAGMEGKTTKISFNAKSASQAAAFDIAGGYQGAGWYTAVPEPTSGLLMLLGMAGLALRRRRA